MWRPDAGPDHVLYTTNVTEGMSDGGYPIIAFSTSLAAVPASCGDLLVLQLTLLSDGGEVFEAFPTMSVP